MNLEEVKEKCTNVSIATINLGNEYSLTKEVKWLIERAEHAEILQNRINKVLEQCAVNWINKTLKGE